jgi:hypothetical protein
MFASEKRQDERQDEREDKREDKRDDDARTKRLSRADRPRHADGKSRAALLDPGAIGF